MVEIRIWELGGEVRARDKNLRVTILKIESKSRGIFVTFYAL